MNKIAIGRELELELGLLLLQVNSIQYRLGSVDVSGFGPWSIEKIHIVTIVFTNWVNTKPKPNRICQNRT